MDIAMYITEFIKSLPILATFILTCMGILTWTYGFREVWNKGFKNPWIQIKPMKKTICDYTIVDEGQYMDNDSVNLSKKITNPSERIIDLKIDPFGDFDSERIKVFISERPDRVLILKTKRKKTNEKNDNKFHSLGPVRIDDITNKSDKIAERLLDYRVGFIYHQIKENEAYCKKN